MRVLQLIDTLNAGGAEQIAVGLANALASNTESSYLCVTREEGILKQKLNDNVGYLFLDKKNSLDIFALFKLRRFIGKHDIDIVHAHTTSFFFATLLKMVYPGIKLIWHEHHGNRVNTTRSNNHVLYLCSFFFYKIVTVNEALRLCCLKNLKSKRVIYLPNFIDFEEYEKLTQESRKNIIVCLANLRKPKNHLNLLEAFRIVHKKHPTWKLQLIGSKENIAYCKVLKKYIGQNNLQSATEILGLRSDILYLLNKAKIGVLSSDSEGLPMALLEYGASKLAVVVTDVGFCKTVVGINGETVEPQNSEALANAICLYIENDLVRERDALNFYKHVRQNYSLDTLMPILNLIYK
jgi:glycosyltransferase involved in cell wall biosynthesis